MKLAAACPWGVQAANITCAGILSHESAMRGGERIALPAWTLVTDSKPTTIPLDEHKEPPWAGLDVAAGSDVGELPRE